MSDAQLECALDLMRRLPPTDTEENLTGLVNLQPDLTEALLSSVDQKLQVRVDPVLKREYLLCDFNRDGDSYRSPWTNKYYPELEDGALPSERLYEMEKIANEVFARYRDLYFTTGAISSCYFWDLDEGFAACILIKKEGKHLDNNLKEGSWDSIHVVEVIENERGGSAHYKLTTTIMLELAMANNDIGNMNLAGTFTRQTEEDRSVNYAKAADVDLNHLAQIGRMVENMESSMRSAVEIVYFDKTKDIVNALRNVVSREEIEGKRRMQEDIMRGMQAGRK